MSCSRSVILSPDRRAVTGTGIWRKWGRGWGWGRPTGMGKVRGWGKSKRRGWGRGWGWGKVKNRGMGKNLIEIFFTDFYADAHFYILTVSEKHQSIHPQT